MFVFTWQCANQTNFSSFFSKNNFPWINPIFLFQSFSMTSHMFNPFNPKQNPIICFGIILCHLRPSLASELPIFYILSRILQISLPYPPYFSITFPHFPTVLLPSHPPPRRAAPRPSSPARLQGPRPGAAKAWTSAWSLRGFQGKWWENDLYQPLLTIINHI